MSTQQPKQSHKTTFALPLNSPSHTNMEDEWNYSKGTFLLFEFEYECSMLNVFVRIAQLCAAWTMDGFLIAISIFVLQRVVCLCLGNLRPPHSPSSGQVLFHSFTLLWLQFLSLFLFQAVGRQSFTLRLAFSSYEEKFDTAHTPRKNCLTTAVTIEFALLPFAAFGFYIDFGQVLPTGWRSQNLSQLSGQLTFHANGNANANPNVSIRHAIAHISVRPTFKGHALWRVFNH